MKEMVIIVLTACLASVTFPADAGADQILLKLEGWTVLAPDRIDCTRAPVLKVTGPDNLFNESNRAHLQAVRVGIGPRLVKQCPKVRDVILENGRARRVI